MATIRSTSSTKGLSVKPLAVLLVILGCASLASCGSHAQQSQPPLSVNVGPQLQFAGSTVSVFELVPTGTQSGTVCLDVVAHGRATALQSLRFVGMKKAGSVAVQVSGDEISLTGDVSAASVSSDEGQSDLPKHAVASGTAWGGTPVWADGSTYDCWAQSYFIGSAPSESGSGIGDLRILLVSSRQYPSVRFYCLAVKLDARRGSTN